MPWPWLFLWLEESVASVAMFSGEPTKPKRQKNNTGLCRTVEIETNVGFAGKIGETFPGSWKKKIGRRKAQREYSKEWRREAPWSQVVV